MRNRVWVAFLMLAMQGCDNGFVKEIHLTDRYYLTAVDTQDQLHLSYKSDPSDTGYQGVLPEIIYAVGFDTKYIIAKQHPPGSFGPNRQETYYFIVPIQLSGGRYPGQNKIGPLSKEEFEQKRTQLAIPDTLNFFFVYKDLE